MLKEQVSGLYFYHHHLLSQLVSKLWIFDIRQIILIRMIERLRTHPIPFLVLPNTNIPIHNRQQRSNDARDNDNSEARNVPGRIFGLEDKRANKIACTMSA